MSNHQTLKDSHSVTSSQELVDGAEPCSLRDGVQTDLFGQEALPVSPFQQQEKGKEKTMSDTSGLSSSISSESANLQQSLANRLRQLFDLGGSTIYKLTLKEKVTPQQRQYYQLGASAPRTKGTDSSLPPSAWPTPDATCRESSLETMKKRRDFRKKNANQNSVPMYLTDAVLVMHDKEYAEAMGYNEENLSAWLTPTTSDMNGVREMDGKRSGGLNTQAQSAWPTPLSSDNRDRGKFDNPAIQRRIRLKKSIELSMMVQSAWPTPAARDVKGVSGLGRQEKKGNPSDTVPNAAATVPWATPNTMDHMALRSDEALLRQATVARKGRTFPANLREQVDPRSQEIYASGKIPQSSTAETENTVPSQLNPRFSLWLMGYPIEWAYSGERVTPLSRKRQRKS
jgi:hypothetical protein